MGDALDTITSNSESFPLARESEELPLQVRQMLYGAGKRKTHRILFAVRPDRIVVHRIRHVAQGGIERPK
ncbi:MAG TPA: hypothetical protein DDW52_05290 [Planctomycetaceae bacterium]|nr:hypothetical protein [Planctomycetaceae bacterium]